MFFFFAAFCPLDENNSSNYGNYTWSRSGPEEFPNFDCQFLGPNSNPKVRRRCNERGKWEHVIFDECWTQAEQMLNGLNTDVSITKFFNHLIIRFRNDFGKRTQPKRTMLIRRLT